MWLSGKTEARESYMLETRFPVTGLNVQAPVRFRGVEVGKVETIEFLPNDARVILVRIAVRADTPITKGTYAQLGSQGVTGLAYVLLDDEGKNPERVAGGDLNYHIPVRASFLDEISGSGRELLTDVRQVASRVNVLLTDSNQAQLMRSLAGLERATNRVSELAAKFEPAIAKVPALTDDARKAVAHADELMVNLNKLTLELTRRVDARRTGCEERRAGRRRGTIAVRHGGRRDPAAHTRPGRGDRPHLEKPRPPAGRPERAALESRVRPAGAAAGAGRTRIQSTSRSGQVKSEWRDLARCAAVGMLCGALAACSLGPKTEQPATYDLGAPRSQTPASPGIAAVLYLPEATAPAWLNGPGVLYRLNYENPAATAALRLEPLVRRRPPRCSPSGCATASRLLQRRAS